MERRTTTRKALDIEPDVHVVGHVGRFQPVKNHEFIVRVFSELLKRDPGALLLLAGEGETMGSTKGLVDALGINASVRFLGVRSDVANLMQAMDVFIMPSLYEGLPMVLVEAQSSGLPCLISETIPDDCDIDRGLVCRLPLSDSVDKWASRLSECIVSEGNRACGVQAVQAAGFDAIEQANRLQEFYLQRVGEAE